MVRVRDSVWEEMGGELVKIRKKTRGWEREGGEAWNLIRKTQTRMMITIILVLGRLS